MVIKHSIGTIQLDTFSNYFSSFNEQYVLIGGTATMLLLSEVGFSIGDLLKVVGINVHQN